MRGWESGLLLAVLGATWSEGLASSSSISNMAHVLQRPIRSISFPENSNMGIFLALAVPLNEPLNSISLSYFFEANYVLPANLSMSDDDDDDGPSALYTSRSSSSSSDSVNSTSTATIRSERRSRSIDRSTIYSVISSKFESAGFPGHECLLQSICEASEYPLQHNGVLGDIFHVVFTPSSSRAEDQLADGIIEAELKGRNGTCYDYRSLCPLGLFDLIGILL